MENPIKIDDLGVPLFSETSIYQLFRRISSMIGRDSVDSPGRQQITRLVTGNVCRDLSVEWRSRRSLWAKKDVNKKETWVLPKMVVPPKHRKRVIFSRKTNDCLVPPF